MVSWLSALWCSGQFPRPCTVACGRIMQLCWWWVAKAGRREREGGKEQIQLAAWVSRANFRAGRSNCNLACLLCHSGVKFGIGRSGVGGIGGKHLEFFRSLCVLWGGALRPLPPTPQRLTFKGHTLALHFLLESLLRNNSSKKNKTS